MPLRRNDTLLHLLNAAQQRKKIALKQFAPAVTCLFRREGFGYSDLLKNTLETFELATLHPLFKKEE